ncbi:MAG: hemerythrin domain-containing protein [Candidatus Accumulibacter meliphilus]|uniref:Hemerythrin domain-containing protein n=1 Tax=Candidatus Accumulibacter meliphilus TaxID=2211374 RepID=A0A369XJS9_9PROT|nr:MAG: hemerythrin domain-containing protein [Candidatus Accumulibacter meliphilus]
MLSACHHRIEAQCATLRRLVPHLLARGVDDEARAVANKLIAFFDTAVMQHHADEEEHLFPALIESMAGSDAICLRQMVDGLTADHRTLEACWQHLRGVLERIAAGECVPLLADAVEVLAACHERHMQHEERELLPMAARLLSDEDLARLEHAMRGRR